MNIKLLVIGIALIIGPFVDKWRDPENPKNKTYIFSFLLGITSIISAFYFTYP